MRITLTAGRVTATDMSPTGDKGLDVMIGRIGEGEQKAVWANLSRDPFIVVGVMLTRYRLRDARLPGWLVVLFFVPLGLLGLNEGVNVFVTPSPGAYTMRAPSSA
mgnify:CR=1 FL=1